MPRDATLSFRVLGPLEVDAGAGPLPLGGPKQRAVLGSLLLRANQVVPADTLIDDVWGEEPPDRARNSLHTYVSNLRRAIGEERLQGRPPGYRLVVRPAELDSSRFDALVRDARTALPIDPTVAVATLEDALALWRGPALADLAAQPSFLAEAARLDDLRLQAQEDRIEGMLAAGVAGRAVGEIEALLAHYPLRESLWGRLMLALYRDGRQADSLNAYQRAREVLTGELGIEPSQELRRLQERILQQDPRLELRGEPLRGYRLLEQVGEGGSSLCFRAIQPHVERDVAVRIVRESLADDPDFARRFEADAQVVAALEHPHIAPVYDYWREPGRAYVVSRYLRGGSLADLEARGEPLDAQAARRVVEQVASALAFAHRQGMVHGRVRPSNVLLDGDGNAYLGDFPVGSAAPADPAVDRRHLADLARRLLGDAAPGNLAGGDVPPVEADEVGQARNPYKGLRPFGEADARDFFGRGDLVRRMVARLREAGPEARFLAVVGPSGGGKSSAVRAGLVPALRRDDLALGAPLFVVEMQPGPHPIAELEAALVRLAVRPVSRLHDLLDAGSRGLLDAVDLVLPAGAEAVLIVDQLEETFTLARDPAERALFLEALRVAVVDPASRLRVIVTLRADFYDRPLTYPRFGELMASRTEAVPPLTPDEEEQAIREPAAQVGVRPERGLVAELIADIAHQPGALPLLQFALTELFERRSGDRLTRAAFREIGGVAGALSARAERIYAGLDTDGQDAARQVFLRLVELGEGRPDTRRRVPLAELDAVGHDPETVERVLDQYGRHRLLTFDREPGTREPTAEVAHEAILTAWGRLREWIDEARDDLRQHRRMARSAVEWRASGRDPSFLLTGSRLDATEAWAAAASLALGAEEREYLKASLDRRQQERAADARRRNREVATERRSRSRLRALVAVLTGAMVIAGVLTVVAMRNSDQAEHEATIATARELAAAAVGSLQSDPERSLLLALEAVETTRRSGDEALPEAQEALHQAVIGSRVVRSFDANGGSAALSSDGVLATRSAEAPGSVDLRDAATGRLIRTFPAHGRPVGDLAFSADGGLLATTGGDGRLRVWNTATGALVAEVRRRGGAGSPSFSGNGARVAASWEDETAVVMGSASGRVLGTLHGVGWARPIDLSPDGRRAVYSHGSGAVIALVDTGDVVMPLAGEYPANDVAWSPNGRRVAVVSNGGAGEIWDARTGRRTLILPHRGIILAVAWAPDSSHLVTGALDGTARVWETHAADVTEVARLSAQDTSSGIDRVGFSASGEQAFTVDAKRSAVKFWAVGRAGEAEWANLPAAAFLGDVEFLPDGRLAASVADGAVGVWNRELTRRIDVVGPELDGWPWFDVSPDGKWLAVGAGHVTGWDLATGARLFDTPEWPTAGDAAWSPDARYVVAPRDDHSVGVIDRTGRMVRVLPVPPALEQYSPRDALFSPDGRFVAAAVRRDDDIGAVVVWEWRSGEVVRTIDVLAETLTFAPDGSRIAVAEPRGGGAIYDIATGGRVADLRGHTSAVIDVEFSPDGSQVATAGFSDAVRLFDADDGSPLLVLHSPEAAVSEIGFSADGRKLAAFSPDVGGDGIGSVRVWALDVADLVRIARSKVTRGFTEDECRRFLHQAHCRS